jgi:riboflavin kinase/FMN adenylyltransferase
MEIIREPTLSTDLPRGGLVTVGNFDGVHRGHQLLVREAVARARELDVPAVVLTFFPHPEKVLRPQSGTRLLTTRTQKAQLLERLGVETLIEIGFSREFAATPAEEFARAFLHDRLQPREVRIGPNFRFGAGRQGDLEFLEAIGARLGFDVVGVKPVMDNGDPISSSRVRRRVAEGDVAEAWRLLGRPYFVDGDVFPGERMGRQIGFPTINVKLDNELPPAQGVYVTAAHIPSFERLFPSVTNYGVRPTVYEDYPTTLESHLLDFTADVYEEPVRVFFLARLRAEMAFPNSMALTAQIRRDVDAARAYLSDNGLPSELLILR